MPRPAEDRPSAGRRRTSTPYGRSADAARAHSASQPVFEHRLELEWDRSALQGRSARLQPRGAATRISFRRLVQRDEVSVGILEVRDRYVVAAPLRQHALAASALDARKGGA